MPPLAVRQAALAKKTCATIGTNQSSSVFPGGCLGNQREGEKYMATPEENDREDAGHRAFECYGTAMIFERREKPLIYYSKTAKLIEFIAPLTAGSAAITFGINSSLMPKLLPIAGGSQCS